MGQELFRAKRGDFVRLEKSNRSRTECRVDFNRPDVSSAPKGPVGAAQCASGWVVYGIIGRMSEMKAASAIVDKLLKAALYFL
jgi:hypothetical protein